MEEPAQTVKDGHKRVSVTTPIVSLHAEKNICKIEKNPHKIENSKSTPVIIDYTKLHKHYLKLSKIKLTCMYINHMYMLDLH